MCLSPQGFRPPFCRKCKKSMICPTRPDPVSVSVSASSPDRKGWVSASWHRFVCLFEYLLAAISQFFCLLYHWLSALYSRLPTAGRRWLCQFTQMTQQSVLRSVDNINRTLFPQRHINNCVYMHEIFRFVPLFRMNITLIFLFTCIRAYCN